MDAFVRTAFLLAVMTAIFMGFGWILGGMQGAVLALCVAAAMNFWAWWNSDKAVLRMHGAEPLAANDRTGLIGMTADLAKNADMPMPAVYLMNTDQPNAFATGRSPDNAAVAVTTGLLQRLNREEIAGVIAHELAHIKNRDTLLMTISATFAGAISMLANFALFLGNRRDSPLGIVGIIAMTILSPLAAALVQASISRTREFKADRDGAEICGNPEWLANALKKIAGAAARIDNNRAERHPGTAHMFIINPLHAHGYDRLFATHPPVDIRIAKLMELMPKSAARPARRGPW